MENKILPMVSAQREVDSNMITLGYKMRLGELLRQFQQIGTDHLESTGHGLAVMTEQNEAYLLSRTSIKINRLPKYMEKFTAKTCTPRFEGVFNVRYYSLVGEDGEVIADGMSYWTLLNIATKRIIRPSRIEQRYLPLSEEFTVSAQPPARLSAPENMTQCGTHKVIKGEVDQYGHLNNTRYLDILTDFLDEDKVGALTLCFNKELPLGSEFVIKTDGSGTFTYEKEGTVCFIAKVEPR